MIYEKYEKMYLEKATDTSNELLKNVWIGTMYCNETDLNPNDEGELNRRLLELSELGEETLIDAIFDAINAPIYRKRGMI